MLEQRYIKEHLERSSCHKCGSSLGGAKLSTISDAPVALVAHAVCPNCRSESMLTITPAGSGIVPLVSDLTGPEIKKFLACTPVSYDDVLNIHKILKKDSIWNLLLKKEKQSVKRSKT
jgi:ribosomal protein S27AE